MKTIIRTASALLLGAALIISCEKKQDPVGEEDSIKSFNPNARGVEKGYKYCRNCGNKLPEDANFCDKCGQSLNY